MNQIIKCLIIISYGFLLVFKGSTNAIFIIFSLVSVYIISFSQDSVSPRFIQHRLDNWDKILVFSFCAPLIGLLCAFIGRGSVNLNEMDSTARFLLGIPIYLYIRSQGQEYCSTFNWGVSIGAILSGFIALYCPFDYGNQRYGTSFLNPIHFGNIAITLGALVIFQGRIGALKFPLNGLVFVGIFAALSASVISGTRGGWIIVLPLIALAVHRRAIHNEKTAFLNLWCFVALVGLVLLMFIEPIAIRIESLVVDFLRIKDGDYLNSIGIRLLQWEIVFSQVGSHFIFGQSREDLVAHIWSLDFNNETKIILSEYTRAELHNEFIFRLATYGVVGLIAFLPLLIVPLVFFVRHVKSKDSYEIDRAYQGMALIISFSFFCLTAEMFNIVMTSSFFALSLAIIAGIVRSTQLRNANNV